MEDLSSFLLFLSFVLSASTNNDQNFFRLQKWTAVYVLILAQRMILGRISMMTGARVHAFLVPIRTFWWRRISVWRYNLVVVIHESYYVFVLSPPVPGVAKKRCARTQINWFCLLAPVGMNDYNYIITVMSWSRSILFLQCHAVIHVRTNSRVKWCGRLIPPYIVTSVVYTFLKKISRVGRPARMNGRYE